MVRRCGVLCACAVAALGFCAVAPAAQVVVDTVPSYLWYGGCGPTAAGMILGYWDAGGFDGLISAGDGTNSWDTNNQAVKDMIASEGYFEDYWPTPDRTPSPPYHQDDCVADFMGCSRDPLGPGVSGATSQDDGLVGYAAMCGYTSCSSGWQWYNRLWDLFVDEIDAARPMEFFVDISGNGYADHFVTAIGYDDTPGSPRYACHDTYSHDVRWSDFVPTSSRQSYSVYTGTWFDPGSAQLAGDLDADGFVDGQDLNIVLCAWGDDVGDAGAPAGDPSGNGLVDGEDLNVVLTNWGAGQSAQTPIPEPSTLAILVASAAMIGRVRRGKTHSQP